MAVTQAQQPNLLNQGGSVNPETGVSKYDLPVVLPSNDVKIEVPPPSMGADETPAMRDNRLLQAATIKSAADGSSISDNFAAMTKLQKSGQAQLLEASTKWNKDIQQAQNELVQNSFSQIPDPTEYVKNLAAERAKQDQKAARTSAGQRAVAETTQAPFDLQEEMVARQQGIDMAEGIVKDDTMMDKLGEIALSFVPFKLSIDDWQTLGFHLNPWKAAEEYRQLATKIQALPPDEKLRQLELLKTEWLDKLPHMRAVTMLSGLIDPAQTEEAANSLGLGAAIDNAFDLTILWSLFGGMRKTNNLIASLSKLGDKKKAAEINRGVLEGEFLGGSEGMNKVAQTDRLIANANASPFRTDEVIVESADDIAPAMQEELFKFKDKINATMSKLSDEEGFVKEGLLDKADRKAAITRIDTEWDAWTAQILKNQNKIMKTTARKETNRGVLFEYEVTDAYGNLSHGKTIMPFKFTDIHGWQNIPDNVLSTYLGSQKWQAHGSDWLDSLEAAIRLDTTSAAVSTQFRKLMKEATKPLRKGLKGKKQKLKDVDSILIFGDQQGKVFKPKELNMGVNGIQLDNDQIEAYYKIRSVIDSLAVLRNQEKYNDLYARGAKAINFEGGTVRFGEVKQTHEEASLHMSHQKGDVNKVWVHDGEGKGYAVDANRLKMKELYDNGYRMVKLEDDILREGGVFKHLLVKPNGRIGGKLIVDELPYVVEDLKPGYVPRLNKQATWFVQGIRDSYVDGKLVTAGRRKAVRSFDNERDAQDWAEYMKVNAEKEGFDLETKFIAVKDGELEAFRAGDSQLGVTKGLITGHRSASPIPHGFPGQFDVTDMRVKAFEAIELYLENTKNYMTRNQWRMGMRLKWEKTAEMMLGGIKVKFDDPGQALMNNRLRKMHERITQWSGFRDKSERGFSEVVRKAYEFSLRVPVVGGRNVATKFIFNMKDKNPFVAMRSMAFHALLGNYNPAQLWVQAQGMMAAAAVNLAHPLSGGWKRVITSGTKQIGLAMLNTVPNASDDVLKQIVKLYGFKNVQELRDLQTLWRKTGYADSMFSSADVEAAARGFPTTQSAFRKFFDTGLVFFRGGEGFNRRYSFISAVDEVGGASEVIKSEDALKGAMDRANSMMGSLSESNKAIWQSGPISLFTQFLQIQTKTLETLAGMGTKLTGRERASLFLSQAMLYGPAGIFLGNYMSKYAMSLKGIDQEDLNNMPPEKVAFFNGGLTDYMLALYGIDGSASDRAALINGLGETVKDVWTKENTLPEWLLGPSGVPPKRVWQQWAIISTFGWTPHPTDGRVDVTAQDVTDALTYFSRDMGKLIISPFSTASQISRWWLMRDLGVIKDTQGNTIAQPSGGYNAQTEWATLVGLKPNDLQKKFDLADMNKAYDDNVELRVNMLMAMFDDYMSRVDQKSKEQTEVELDEMRLFRKRWSITIDSIEDPGIREKVREIWSDRLERRLSGDSQLDRQTQEYYRNMNLDLVGAHTATGTRLIQTRENDNGVQ